MSQPKGPPGAEAPDGSLAPSAATRAGRRERRWWESGPIAAVAGAIAVLLAPGTTWLSSYGEQQVALVTAQKQRELERQKQEHAVRMEFFTKVVNPSGDMTPEARIEALRYFKAVLPEGELRSWASGEYASLVKTKAKRDEAAKQEQEAASVVTAATQEIEESIEELDRAKDEKKKAELEKHIQKKAAKLSSARAKLESAKSELESADRVLKESVPPPVSEPIKPSAALELSPSRVAMATQIAAQLQPVAPRLSVGFSSSRKLLRAVDDVRFYRFSVRTRGEARDLDQIARVDYSFEDASVGQSLWSESRATRFEVSYTGSACARRVSAKLTLVNGTTLNQRFDLCAALGD